MATLEVSSKHRAALEAIVAATDKAKSPVEPVGTGGRYNGQTCDPGGCRPVEVRAAQWLRVLGWLVRAGLIVRTKSGEAFPTNAGVQAAATGRVEIDPRDIPRAGGFPEWVPAPGAGSKLAADEPPPAATPLARKRAAKGRKGVGR